MKAFRSGALVILLAGAIAGFGITVSLLAARKEKTNELTPLAPEFDPPSDFPKAHSIQELVTEWEGREKEGVNPSEWELGPIRELRLLGAALKEKQAREGGDRVKAIVWLAKLLKAGGDFESVEAVAGECNFDEACKALDALPERSDDQLGFAMAILARQGESGLTQGLAWLKELTRRGVLPLMPARDGNPDSRACTVAHLILWPQLKKDSQEAGKALVNGDVPKEFVSAFVQEWASYPEAPKVDQLCDILRTHPRLTPVTDGLAFQLGQWRQAVLMDLLIHGETPPDERKRMEESTFEDWAKQRPGEAFPWLLKHGEELAKKVDWEGAHAYWIHSSPPTLVADVEAQSAGADKDRRIAFILKEGVGPPISSPGDDDPNDPIGSKSQFRHFDRAQIGRLIAGISDPAARQEATARYLPAPAK